MSAQKRERETRAELLGPPPQLSVVHPLSLKALCIEIDRAIVVRQGDCVMALL